MTGIYCIENTVNHKKYVGMAQDINARWRSHKCELRNGNHVNCHLQRAWNIYGEKAFRFYILEETSIDQLPEAEIKWIQKLNTFGEGYNLTAGGEGQYGRCLTDEQKAHLSKINTGKLNPNYGLKRSEKTRKKMSDSMRGKKHGPMSEHQRKAISNGNKGKKRPWFNKPVVWLETGKSFSSISEAAAYTGLSISGISSVCLGKRNSIYKQHFSFMEATI